MHSVTESVRRLAHISYTFVMMNVAAISGLVALARGRQVWK
jgi:hypothetical protein